MADPIQSHYPVNSAQAYGDQVFTFLPCPEVDWPQGLDMHDVAAAQEAEFQELLSHDHQFQFAVTRTFDGRVVFIHPHGECLPP